MILNGASNMNCVYFQHSVILAQILTFIDVHSNIVYWVFINIRQQLLIFKNRRGLLDLWWYLLHLCVSNQRKKLVLRLRAWRRITFSLWMWWCIGRLQHSLWRVFVHTKRDGKIYIMSIHLSLYARNPTLWVLQVTYVMLSTANDNSPMRVYFG